MINQRGYTVFDLLSFGGFFVGIFIGSKYGYINFGMVGGLAGAVIGGGAGFLVCRLPYVFASRLAQRSLEKESSQHLRERLRSDNEYYIAHLLLAHLMKRGEDITDELPSIINLIRSESSDRRCFGWAALKFAFPETASKIAEYQPKDSTDKCRTIASRLDC
ncbi:MAG: hypothetical protein HQK58_12395 [Deltaproteobacteria bacterium]|nr:hypothetical protein [Deltaproteobacteria bacterium]